MHKYFNAFRLLASLLMIMLWSSGQAAAQNQGLGTDDGTASSDQFADALAVRNAAPIAGDEIAILRTFKIEKGAYDEFYRQSVEGVWPYFEKIGARIVGMWLVNHDAVETSQMRDYDEVILLTRYASVDHWQASRDPLKVGGNGPDAKALADAHAYRQSVTKSTTFLVLSGTLAHNGPYYMPAIDQPGGARQ
jgi:hypothetical protein